MKIKKVTFYIFVCYIIMNELACIIYLLKTIKYQSHYIINETPKRKKIY